MKKILYNQNLSNTNKTLYSNKENLEVKTTNVNILLNRVKLERKKTFNKRILFSLSLISTISLLVVFLIFQS